jgi:hypothetical protein
VWLFRAKDKTHFISATAPDGTTGAVVVGTLWSDTTANLLKRCTATAPITFVSVEGGGGGGTLADGDYTDITVSGSATVFTIDNGAVTYAKMQNVSATDKLLGRSTAGAGVVEEITCTAAGRALLDDADAAGQRTTLGLGTIATQNANNVSISGGAVTGITDLAIADGGTGASTKTAAFDALSPLTTQGDLIAHDGTNNVRVAKGTAKQVFKMNSGATASEWVTQEFPIGLFTNVQTVSNIPAGTTEFPAAPRLRTDLSFWNEVRYMASIFVVGNAGSNLFLQYSTDAAAWSTFTTNTIALNATGAPTRTAFESIPSGAKADVYLRVVTNGGDGAADPIVGYIYMILR